jgi:Flp pilus assembly protein TadD
MDQYELALDWLQRAVRLNPDHFRAQVNLGVTLYTLERYDEAVVAYRAALALNPADALVHADLGRSLLKVGLDGEGLRELQTAVGLDPSLTAERELVARRLSGDPRGASTPLASR